MNSTDVINNSNTYTLKDFKEAISLFLKKDSYDISYPVVRQLSCRKYSEAKDCMDSTKIVDISHSQPYEISPENREYRYLVEYNENEYFDVLKKNDRLTVIEQVYFN